MKVMIKRKKIKTAMQFYMNIWLESFPTQSFTLPQNYVVNNILLWVANIISLVMSKIQTVQNLDASVS